jgi:hypothetical protein
MNSLFADKSAAAAAAAAIFPPPPAPPFAVHNNRRWQPTWVNGKECVRCVCVCVER